MTNGAWSSGTSKLEQSTHGCIDSKRSKPFVGGWMGLEIEDLDNCVVYVIGPYMILCTMENLLRWSRWCAVCWLLSETAKRATVSWYDSLRSIHSSLHKFGRRESRACLMSTRSRSWGTVAPHYRHPYSNAFCFQYIISVCFFWRVMHIEVLLYCLCVGCDISFQGLLGRCW